MGHRMYWEQEPWIFVVEYFDTTTRDDIETVMIRCLELADKGPIYFLVDTTHSTGFETSVLKVSLLTRLVKHPNVRWFAFVGVHGLFRFAVQVGMHLATPFKVFSERTEGVTFLREMAESQHKSVTSAASSPQPSSSTGVQM